MYTSISWPWQLRRKIDSTIIYSHWPSCWKCTMILYSMAVTLSELNKKPCLVAKWRTFLTMQPFNSAVYVPTHVQRGCREHTFYMWRIHNFHTTCQLPVVFRFEGTPLHMCRKCSYTHEVLKMTKNSEYYMHNAPILSKLHTNYKTKFLI